MDNIFNKSQNHMHYTVRALIFSTVIGAQPKVLLLKRPENINLAGQEEPPGGRAKEGENLKDAVQREILEETAIHIPLHKIHYLNSFSYQDNQGIYRNEHFFYVILVEQNVEVHLAEHTSHRWVTITELKKANLHPVVRDFIIKYLDDVKFFY